MKIQLFYPPSGARPSSSWYTPPLGLLYLASYARSLHPDIQWKISDGQRHGEGQVLSEFRSFKPDLAGLSFLTVHAPAAYRLMSKLRAERPDLPIVCGGVHPSAMPEEVLSLSPADIVVVGEGEAAFANILDEFMNGEATMDRLQRACLGAVGCFGGPAAWR